MTPTRTTYKRLLRLQSDDDGVDDDEGEDEDTEGDALDDGADEVGRHVLLHVLLVQVDDVQEVLLRSLLRLEDVLDRLALRQLSKARGGVVRDGGGGSDGEGTDCWKGNVFRENIYDIQRMVSGMRG